jgi:hypothetical protein
MRGAAGRQVEEVADETREGATVTYQIEMLWRCHVCKHAGNRGLKRHCSNCGHPKSDKDEEYFPDATKLSPEFALEGEAAERAKAGPDWKCKYCGSLESSFDKCCTECGVDPVTGGRPWEAVVKTLKFNLNSGSESVHAAMIGEDVRAAVPGARVQLRRKPMTKGAALAPAFAEAVQDAVKANESAGYRDSARVPDETPPVTKPLIRLPHVAPRIFVAIFVAFVLALGLWQIFRTKIVTARVESVHWEHRVLVDRYKVFHRDGFDPEPSAFHVTDLGPRFHHMEHVRTGSHTESYTERVTCGQDCQKQSCYTTSRSCTSNRNGTATCTGGDRVCPPDICTTRYCDERRTRSVDDYEDQPRYRDYYMWDAWDWGRDRTIRRAGDTLVTAWPTPEECAPSVPLGEGESERSSREETYETTFVSGAGKSRDMYVYTPQSEEDFQRYPVGTERKLKVGIAHGVEVLEK